MSLVRCTLLFCSLFMLTIAATSCASSVRAASASSTATIGGSTASVFTTSPAVTHSGVVVQGILTWQEWKNVAQWSSYADDALIPPPVLALSKGKLQTGSYTFIVVGGTWCGDSKRGMPHIFGLLSKLEVPDRAITLIGVNESKQEPKEWCTRYGITYVPTLIVLLDNKEIGRIVENPQQSWHDDFLKILLQ
jgi:thiol-disulfide isomerase/thioredoxin